MYICVVEYCNMNWTLCLFIIGCFCCKYLYAQQQRIPPGVSPQHYQQVSFSLQIVKHMVTIMLKLNSKFLIQVSNIHLMFINIMFLNCMKILFLNYYFIY